MHALSVVLCVSQGAVGNDEFATRMETVARGDGVTCNYVRADGAPTGKCAVLVVDGERSLVASLGAAEHYKARSRPRQP
jgi:adenosine kinase